MILRPAHPRDIDRIASIQRNADARRFYAARGFVEVALTDGTRNDEREPNVRMVWTR